jgi:hypothetical protein
VLGTYDDRKFAYYCTFTRGRKTTKKYTREDFLKDYGGTRPSTAEEKKTSPGERGTERGKAKKATMFEEDVASLYGDIKMLDALDEKWCPKNLNEDLRGELKRLKDDFRSLIEGFNELDIPDTRKYTDVEQKLLDGAKKVAQEIREFIEHHCKGELSGKIQRSTNDDGWWTSALSIVMSGKKWVVDFLFATLSRIAKAVSRKVLDIKQHSVEFLGENLKMVCTVCTLMAIYAICTVVRGQVDAGAFHATVRDACAQVLRFMLFVMSSTQEEVRMALGLANTDNARVVVASVVQACVGAAERMYGIVSAAPPEVMNELISTGEALSLPTTTTTTSTTTGTTLWPAIQSVAAGTTAALDDGATLEAAGGLVPYTLLQNASKENIVALLAGIMYALFPTLS